MNDAHILYVLGAFFLISGVIIGLVESEINGTSVQGGKLDVIQGQFDEFSTKEDSGLTGYFSAFDIIWGILKMATWTFGTLPLLFDVIVMIPIRLLFWFTLIRNVWIGGGS